MILEDILIKASAVATYSFDRQLREHMLLLKKKKNKHTRSFLHSEEWKVMWPLLLMKWTRE